MAELTKMTSSNHSESKREVIAWLREITRGEFARIVYAVVSEWTMESADTKSFYSLACVDFDRGQPPIVNLVALELDDSWAVPMTERDSSFSEGGQCASCNTLVVSVAKRAICPSCGFTVECT
jgi:hypothetical protein